MSTDRTGGGDPARTLALLWRSPGDPGAPGRGPKPGLTVDAVTDAAISVADASGLGAVTMRRVADALGVAPMSLYTYVPGKAELIDLMVDRVYGTMARPEPPAGGHWRARLEAVARDNRALYERHPWVAAVSTARPPLGPGQMAKYEYELRALDGLGLSDIEMDAALTFLLGFVEASARAAAAVRAQRQEEGTPSDREWWEASAPVLTGVLDASRFPTAARVAAGAAAGAAQGGAFDPERAYAFGLGRVLDGLGVLIESRAK